MIATSAVTVRTTLLIARFRYHLRTDGAGAGRGSGASPDRHSGRGSDASPDRHSSRGSGVDSERGSGRGSDAESERGLGRGSGADSERGSGRGSGAGSERGLGRDTLLCEEIVPLACTGAAEAPRWLAPEESERLLTARPERNLLPTALE